MRNKYSVQEYEKIHILVERSISAGTKAEAKQYFEQLAFLESDVTGYSRIVFSELQAAAMAASGAVRDKDRLTNIARECLLKFQMNCVE